MNCADITMAISRRVVTSIFLTLALLHVSAVCAQERPAHWPPNMADPSLRAAVEPALAAKNLLDGTTVCAVGKLPLQGESQTLFVVSIKENDQFCNTVAIVRG